MPAKRKLPAKSEAKSDAIQTTMGPKTKKPKCEHVDSAPAAAGAGAGQAALPHAHYMTQQMARQQLFSCYYTQQLAVQPVAAANQTAAQQNPTLLMPSRFTIRQQTQANPSTPSLRRS